MYVRWPLGLNRKCIHTHTHTHTHPHTCTYTYRHARARERETERINFLKAIEKNDVRPNFTQGIPVIIIITATNIMILSKRSPYEHGEEPSGSIKFQEYPDQARNCALRGDFYYFPKETVQSIH